VRSLRQAQTKRRLAYLRNIKNFSGAQGTFSAVGDGTFTIAAVLKVVTKDGFELLKTP